MGLGRGLPDFVPLPAEGLSAVVTLRALREPRLALLSDIQFVIAAAAKGVTQWRVKPKAIA
jgi:hypothetical protein